MRSFACLGASALLLLATAVTHAAEKDAPSRVGRLSLVSGAVNFRLLTDSDWSEADFNYPVCTGMTLSTGEKAHAEIGFGPNVVQMSSETELEVTTLGNRLTDILLRKGRVHLDLHRLKSEESVELELSRGAVWLLRAGHYEVDLTNETAPGHVSVIDGQARLLAADKDLDIGTGQRALLQELEKVSLVAGGKASGDAKLPLPGQDARGPDQTATALFASSQGQPRNGTGTPVDSAIAFAQSSDGFERWAASRDTLPISDAPENVARDTSGFEMLDSYGNWQKTEAYGRIWFPSEVPPDWQPYRYGHWVSIPPWGPTWIDDQPWGFVPFHYGRWAMVDGRWGWVPGDAVQQQVYAPALVAFVGSPDQPIAFAEDGSPVVGWVPLGPDEPYDPWYSTDPEYVERVNAASVRDFRHLSRERYEQWRHEERHEFANHRFATAVSRAVFVGARPVAASMAHLQPERLARTAAMTSAPPRFGATEGRRAGVQLAVARAPAAAPSGSHEQPGPHGEPGRAGAGTGPGPGAGPGTHQSMGPAPAGPHPVPQMAHQMAPHYQPEHQFYRPAQVPGAMMRPGFQVPNPSRQAFAPQMRAGGFAAPQMRAGNFAMPHAAAPAMHHAAPSGGGGHHR